MADNKTVIVFSDKLNDTGNLLQLSASELHAAVTTWRSGIQVFKKPDGEDRTSQLLAKCFEVLTTAGERFDDITDGLTNLSKNFHSMAVNVVVTEDINKV
jgi:hypothetical protein